MSPGTYQYESSGVRESCEVTFAGNKIYIYFTAAGKELLIWDLASLESCVYVDGGLKIIKDRVPGQSLECTGNLAQTIFRAWTNPVRSEPAGRPKKVMLFFVSCLLAILLVGLLCYVYLLPWIAGKAAGLVPEELEIRLGENLSKAYLAEGQLDDSATFYANRFVKHLNFQSPYPLHIYVLKSEEINAFAVPGGNIFIYSGLAGKMSSYEELVALLCHESTHVIKRHSLKSIMSSAASGVILSAFFGDMNGLSLWAVSKADEFKQLDYSRDLESEADAHGLKLMVQNEVSSKGMTDLLLTLEKESAEMPAMMKYLSTHPETAARISAVKADPLSGRVFPENKALKADFDKLKAAL